jgi:hypothetical protein
MFLDALCCDDCDADCGGNCEASMYMRGAGGDQPLTGYIPPLQWGTISQRGGQLGQFDPATVITIATQVNTAIQTAKNLWTSLLNALGIGAGHREADAITPIQNTITSNVLAPVVAMAEAPAGHSCQDFENAATALNNTMQAFRNHLQTTNWTDGRAAAQALYWAFQNTIPLTVLVNGVQKTFQNSQLNLSTPYGYEVWHAFLTKDLVNMCGAAAAGPYQNAGPGGGGVVTVGGVPITTPPIAGVSATFSTSTLVILGLGAFLLFGGKKGGL